MKAMFSMDEQSWSNPIGMYTTYFESYILLGGGMFAAILGGSILAKEEGDKTADFLMTRPMTRIELITTKIAAYISYIIIMNLIFYVITLIMFSMMIKDFDFGKLSILTVYGLLYSLTIGLIAMLISLFVPRGRSITGGLIGLVFGFYMIKTMAGAVPKIKNLAYISLNKFVNLNVNEAGYKLEIGNVLYFIIFSSVMLTGVYLVYRKKDIFN